MQVAVKRVVSRAARFAGRATRPEFWWWALFAFVLLGFAGLLDAWVVAPLLGFEDGDVLSGRPLSAFVGLAIFLPYIAVTVRRLHDSNRPGWWAFLALIPIIGPVILIYFLIQPSDAERNGYGHPDPLPLD